MIEKYKIENIKPYAKINFQCNFQILFTLIYNMNRSFLPVLTSYMYIYKRNDHELTSEIFVFRKLKQAYEQIGLRKTIKFINRDMIYQIKELILRDIPIGLVIHKQFMKKFQHESQLERNMYHHLLIYGYDDEQNLFETIDHNHYNSFVYSYSTLNYDEVNNFICSFEKEQNDEKNKYVHYYYMEEIDKHPMSFEEIKDLYIYDYKSSQDLVKNSIHEIEQFNKNLNLERIDQFYNNILSINNQKRIELIKLKMLFGEESEIVLWQNDIIKGYVSLTGRLGRAIYNKNISEDETKYVIDYMKQIAEREKLICNKILSI